MPLSEEDQDAFVARLVGSETAPKGAVDYVSTRPPWRLLTPLPNSASARQPRDTVRVVMVSDTHERHHLLDMPPGDVLGEQSTQTQSAVACDAAPGSLLRDSL